MLVATLARAWADRGKRTISHGLATVATLELRGDKPQYASGKTGFGIRLSAVTILPAKRTQIGGSGKEETRW
jgi:hypothetical protein